MQHRPINFVQQEKSTQPAQQRRCIFFILILILLTGVIGCTSRMLGTEKSNDPTAYDPITLEPIEPKGLVKRITSMIFGGDTKLEGQRRDRINLLLLGQGGPGHDGPYLTDTIILASIKPSTGQVSFISIPRDLSVKIPGYGLRKINHANAFGEAQQKGSGAALAVDVIEETFQQEIHYVLRVDFAAFTEVIDEIGGLTVHVDRSFVDTEYPAPNHEYQTIRFTQGIQTMDGDTALKYVRSRHGNNGEGSDFARSRRQQKLILALKEKVLSFEVLSNPVKISNILDSLSEHVLTNLDFSDIISLLKLSKELNTDELITLQLDNGPGGYLQNGFSPNGAFLLVPTAGDYTEIQDAIEHIFEAEDRIITDATPEQEEPVIDYRDVLIEIQNGTWNAGLAARTRNVLLEERFAVSEIGNTNARPQPESGIYFIEKNADQEIVDALAETLGVAPQKTLPPGEQAATSTDILVILGDDFTETP